MCSVEVRADISFDFCIVLLYLPIPHFELLAQSLTGTRNLWGLLGPLSDCPKIGSVSGHSDLKTSQCLPQALLKLSDFGSSQGPVRSKKCFYDYRDISSLPKSLPASQGHVIVSENITLGSAGPWRPQNVCWVQGPFKSHQDRLGPPSPVTPESLLMTLKGRFKYSQNMFFRPRPLGTPK